MARLWRAAAVGVCLSAALAVVQAQMQMPDPRQMSGIPRPVDDLPAGSISVRLIRGDLSQNIANHPVELHVGDKTQTVNTDASGRAQFDKLPAGASLQAIAVVDGERLESQTFPAPAQGGVRLMLVATDKAKEAKAAADAAAPAVTGQVVLGAESRIVVEPAEDRVQVMYLLDIANTSRTPVKPPTPFAFDLPKGAERPVVLEGSTSRATISGLRVNVEGPFAPGQTVAQVAFELPITSSSLTISQVLPVTLPQFTVVMKRLGAVTLSSSLIDRQQEMPVGDGTTYIAALGGTVAAGQPFAFTVDGLPHASAAPRWMALSLASLIALVGVWRLWAKSGAGASASAEERKRLVTRRERLFRDLMRLEHDHRAGRGDPSRYESRREDLVVSLERIYSSLDTDDAPDAEAGTEGQTHDQPVGAATPPQPQGDELGAA